MDVAKPSQIWTGPDWSAIRKSHVGGMILGLTRFSRNFGLTFRHTER